MLRVWNWIQSFFTEQSPQVEEHLEPLSSINAPYTILLESSLTIQQLQEIQNILNENASIYNENNDDSTILDSYNKLILLSASDENVRLYLHELMLFSSLYMKNVSFYVELSMLFIKNYPHLLDFVKSQIFWCFDNCADLYVYQSIEKGLLHENDLEAFKTSITSEMMFYSSYDEYYNPCFRYLRFIHWIPSEICLSETFFSDYYLENQLILEDPNYEKVMRECQNSDQIACFIRQDQYENIEPNNIELKWNIIDRNEFLSFGCSLLEYSAFYGSKNCFMRLFNNIQNKTELKKRRITTFPMCESRYEKKFDLCLTDFAACGGNIEICQILFNSGFEFTSQSLQCSIRYHRQEVFNWLLNELDIEMNDNCWKDSFRYEFIPGIELYDQIKHVNITLEVSKSGNYILFMKYINTEILNQIVKDMNYRYQYAPIMPIFIYNFVDCYRYVFSLSLDMNQCSYFDRLYSKGTFSFCSTQYRNPFHVAIDHQYIDLIQMILAYGRIDLNNPERLTTIFGTGTLTISSGKTWSPLSIAIFTNNYSIVNLLLSIQAIDVNQISYQGGRSSYSMGTNSNSSEFPIIKQAAIHGNLEILELILNSPRIKKTMYCTISSHGTGYSSYNDQTEHEPITKNITNPEVIRVLAKYGIK